MAQGDPRYVGYADAALRPVVPAAGTSAGVLGRAACCASTATTSTARCEDLEARCQGRPARSRTACLARSHLHGARRLPEARRECALLAGPLERAACDGDASRTSMRPREGACRLRGARRALSRAAPMRLPVCASGSSRASPRSPGGWRSPPPPSAISGRRAAARRHDNFLLAAYAGLPARAGPRRGGRSAAQGLDALRHALLRLTRLPSAR